MTPALLAALTGAALTLLAVLAAVVAAANGHRRTRRALEASREEVAGLRARLEELEAARDAAAAATPAAGTAPPPAPARYLITTAGDHDGRAVARREPAVPDRVVLSATVGEPLVRFVSLLYGLRQALSPENRNRIRFEMRREVKRARKQRRRDMRAARRGLQAARRADAAREDAA